MAIIKGRVNFLYRYTNTVKENNMEPIEALFILDALSEAFFRAATPAGEDPDELRKKVETLRAKTNATEDRLRERKA